MAEEKEERDNKMFQLKYLDRAWGHIVSLNEGLNIALRRIALLEERVAALEAARHAAE